MTVKKLVKSTHPILNKTIQPVSTYDQKLKVLLEDLEDTLYHEEAAAISAPQIGVDQSVALIDMEQGYYNLLILSLKVNLKRLFLT